MNEEVMEIAADLFGETNLTNLEKVMENTEVDIKDIEVATRVMKDGVGLVEPIENSMAYGSLAVILVDLSARGGKWGKAALVDAYGNSDMALDIAQDLQEREMTAFRQARTALQNINHHVTCESTAEDLETMMNIGKLNGILDIMSAK